MAESRAKRERRLEQRRQEFEESPLGRGAAPALDARGLSPEAFDDLLRLRGLDGAASGLGPVERRLVPPRRVDPRVLRSAQRAADERARLAEERTRQLAAGAIDAKAASAAQVRDRLRQVLGEPAALGTTVLDRPPELPPGAAARPPDAAQVERERQERRAKVRARVADLIRSAPGGRLDARQLTAEQVEALLELRGVGAGSDWT